MGGRYDADYTEDEKDIAAIKGAIDRGITHIDTAEIYGNNHCEELVGEAIKAYDRKKLIIATKVAGEHQTYDGVLRAAEGSLKRLGVDYLDLYLLHRFPDKGINIKDTMKAMDRLVDQGLVKNVGVCNMTVRRFEAAQNVTRNKVVCNQLHYSLSMREAERAGVIEYCQQNDILITAWGPLEKGELAAAKILEEMAAKYKKTPFQIALNWLISQPNVVTIPKTSTIEHLEENLGAVGWELDASDLERLTKDFPNQQTKSDRVPLDYPTDIEP